MQPLAPCLMFVGDQCGRAQEATDLYLSAFPGSRVLEAERFELEDGRPAVRYSRVEIVGQEVVMMDGPGPHPFGFTPAVSLFVDLQSRELIDAAWAPLTEDGYALMPLQAYDFSPYFGWAQDRFGVSWQLRLAPGAVS